MIIFKFNIQSNEFHFTVVISNQYIYHAQVYLHFMGILINKQKRKCYGKVKIRSCSFAFNGTIILYTSIRFMIIKYLQQ